ncbi:MAG: hypothetical protein HYU88_07240 [Chloroflexi bacterium]|nr:hypothetical protein [Chloroflexota bacterium]
MSDGRHVPLTNKVLVDEQRFAALVEQLRAAVPEELRQVRRLLQDRDRLLAEARHEAERIARHAEEQLEFMLQGNNAIQRAQRSADERLADARRQAEGLCAEAEKYALDLLVAFEREMQRQLAAVRKGLATLERREPAAQ